MNKDDISNFLRKISLFADLEEEILHEISATSQLKHFQRGTMILPTNSSDNALYVVLSGELVGYKDGRNGQEPIEVIRYKPRHYFEVLHLIWSLRVENIKVVDKAELLVINPETLDNIMFSLLCKLPVFKKLSERQLREIAAEVYLECYDAGSILFDQGDSPDALYIVESGEVAVINYIADDDDADNNNNDKRVMEEEFASHRRGQSFGERGVLENLPRTGKAVMRERTSLLVLPTDSFQKLIAKYPDIGNALSLALYSNLANLLEKQSRVARKNAREIERVTNLMQENKMTALGHLVAGVAHEINTPAGSIRSNSNQLQEILAETKELYESLPRIISEFNQKDRLQKIALKEGYDLDDQALKFFDKLITRQLDSIQEYYEENYMDSNFMDLEEISEDLSEAANRISVMVKDLGAFAREGVAKLKEFDVHEGLDSTLSLLRHELKYKVEVETDYHLEPKIVCNPNRLNEVFMNILMNAIHALEIDKLPEGEKGLIRIETYQEEGWAVIAISDTGKGIPADIREKIFDPYFSTKGAAAANKATGLGLGLAISLKIIREQHLGRLDVESEEAIGTTFFIKLPLERKTLPTETT